MKLAADRGYVSLHLVLTNYSAFHIPFYLCDVDCDILPVASSNHSNYTVLISVQILSAIEFKIVK